MTETAAEIIGEVERKCLAFNPFEGDKDDGGATALSDKIVTAAKAHACRMCDGPIAKGERSRAKTEAYEGKVMTFRFCAACCYAMAISWTDDGRALEWRHGLREQRRRDAA